MLQAGWFNVACLVQSWTETERKGQQEGVTAGRRIWCVYNFDMNEPCAQNHTYVQASLARMEAQLTDASSVEALGGQLAEVQAHAQRLEQENEHLRQQVSSFCLVPNQ